MDNRKTIKGYTHINVGASHEEMIPNWLAITIWGGAYEGLEELKTENDITIYRHDDFGGDVINHNVNIGLPFEDSSVEVIFSSHFIEHLTFEEGLNFIKECHRVLKPNGILRIVCPDIMIWIDKVYNAKDIEFFEIYKNAIDVDYWENCVYNVKDKIKTNIQVLNSMIYNWGHKWMWDFESLKTELESVGFGSIEQMEHLKSNIPIIEKIETRLSNDKIEARNLESMFVEAKKPITLL
jgi:predicted SAM-dependent methyltransferase